MDINKVWLSGLVVSRPVQSRIASNAPSTIFTLQVNEKFSSKTGLTRIRPSVIEIESLGKNAERTFNIVKAGQRFTVDGYLRSEVGGVRVRTFAVYPDESLDALSHIEGLKQALEILRKSKDIPAALEQLEELLKT